MHSNNKLNNSSIQETALEARARAQHIAFAPILFQATRVMRDLGVLKALLRQPQGVNAETLATELGLSVYAVRVLLDFGISANLVLLDGERYSATKTAYMLEEDPMTRINMDFVDNVCYEAMSHLDDAVTEGKPVGLKVFGEWPTFYEGLQELPQKARDAWYSFDHFYSDKAFSAALTYVFAQPTKRLFDLGGNTGRWTLRCLEFDPNVEITIVDLPQQLAAAEKNIESKGYKNRVAYYPIDFLDAEQALPPNPDVVWMSQFLDCFGEEEILAVLKQTTAAMSRDSRLYIMEPFVDRQQYSAASFSLNCTSLYFTCIANGNSRMYRATDMIRLIESSGLKIEEDIDNIGLGHTLLKCRLAE